jgi:hypothetical protein
MNKFVCRERDLLEDVIKVYLADIPENNGRRDMKQYFFIFLFFLLPSISISESYGVAIPSLPEYNIQWLILVIILFVLLIHIFLKMKRLNKK